MWGQSQNREGRSRGWKRPPAFGSPGCGREICHGLWRSSHLRQTVPQLVFASHLGPLPPGPQSFQIKPQGQCPLPGRVSKTSLWAATELTSFPRSRGSFSPGCGEMSAARGTGLRLAPAPPLPAPPLLAPRPRSSPGAAPPVAGSSRASPE